MKKRFYRHAEKKSQREREKKGNYIVKTGPPHSSINMTLFLWVGWVREVSMCANHIFLCLLLPI